MRIVSKFKDYYDIGLAYGQDPKLVYVRETSDIPRPKATERKFDSKSYRDTSLLSLNSYGMIRYGNRPMAFSIPSVYIIFCGKMYFGLKVNDKWHYTFESFDKAMMQIEDKDIIEYYLERRKFYEKDTIREGYEKTYKSMVAKSEKNTTEWQRINIENKSPIILIEHTTWKERTHLAKTECVKDPCLKNYNFASIVDPYTAFQELSMFMSNFIGINENPMINISDSDRAAMHGYNEQSFRNPIKIKDIKGA